MSQAIPNNNLPTPQSVPQTIPSTASDPAQAFNQFIMPEPVSQLPAIGWWLLALVSIALIASVSLYCYNQYKIRTAKRQALAAVATASTNLALNSIMKQALLSYLPREQVASLSGSNWLKLQLQLLKQKQQAELTPVLKELNNSLYQKDQSFKPAYQAAASQWLKLALPPQPDQLKQLLKEAS